MDYELTMDAETYAMRKVGHYDEGGLFISTCRVHDAYNRAYETAVAHPSYNDGIMIIVEGYDTKTDALLGHQKWLKRMRQKKLPESLLSIQGLGTFKQKEPDSKC